MKIRNGFLLVSTILLLMACLPTQFIPTSTFTPTVTFTATQTPSPTFTPPPTFTPLPTATPDPYWQYTIDYLRQRTYGSGQIEIIQTLEESEAFNRYLIRYGSDGLNIYSTLNIPNSTGPFPVIIAIHGYERPDAFNLFKEGSEQSDILSQQGYIVFYPALRNYPPSDQGDNLFRVGMAIDTLNLIALLKAEGGQPGALEKANPNCIGLWGFSMGGGVILRVLAVTSDVKAALLYSPVSGDESKNIPLFAGLAGGLDQQFDGESKTPPDSLVNISPSHYYSVITSPLLIFHGTADTVVPVSWTQETCSLLTTAGKNVNCIYYPGAGHTFLSRYLDDFFPRMYEFYRTYLGQ